MKQINNNKKVGYLINRVQTNIEIIQNIHKASKQNFIHACFVRKADLQLETGNSNRYLFSVKLPIELPIKNIPEDPVLQDEITDGLEKQHRLWEKELGDYQYIQTRVDQAVEGVPETSEKTEDSKIIHYVRHLKLAPLVSHYILNNAVSFNDSEQQIAQEIEKMRNAFQIIEQNTLP